MPGIVREQYYVSWILSGAHFMKSQSARFTAVHLRMRQSGALGEQDGNKD